MISFQTLHCFPVANVRDLQEKATQPFFFKTLGVPDVGNHIEAILPYRPEGAEITELRRHIYKVLRVTWTETEVQLLLLEERI